MEERDARPLRLSLLVALVAFLSFVAGLVPAITGEWARDLAGTTAGPWFQSSGTFGRGGASVISGLASLLAALCLAISSFLSVTIVMMHVQRSKVVLKFRHAMLSRVILMTVAAVGSLVAVAAFAVEIYIMNTGSFMPSWGFYLEVIATVLAWLSGILTSLDWHKSRQLGGDPTLYSRDQEGARAETIANPGFRDSKKKPTEKPQGRVHRSPRRHHRPPPSLHHNANGIAMTHASGLPYQATAANGHAAPPSHPAFDPNRIPLRSSLRRNKAQGAPAPDAVDASVGIQNPAFAPSSPNARKKVRINTQSTAV